MARSPAYYPVIAGGLLYFGSSSDDTIYCLDAKTGKKRWSFVTEGPVRLAPAVANGRVFAGSDDGLVYCLDARTGAEVWRYRAGPEDKRLPGNERMISLWPVRCGVIVDEGKVYFSAGIFPAWGVYLCALDARSGTEIWKEDIRVAAQGHLVASPDGLFVATGRTAPRLYERSTGKHVRNLRGGGSFGVLTGRVYAHGGGEKSRSLYLTDAKSGARIMSSPGTRLAANETVLCVLNGNNLTAYDRAQYIGERKAKAKWTIRSSSPVELILAGSAVLVGGENKVSACSTADGKTVWTVGVEGRAYGLAASGGRLYVSTDRGVVHCFVAGGSGATVEGGKKRDVRPYPQDELAGLYRATAAIATESLETRKGYCLVLNADRGRLAREIAARSELRVIGLEKDPQRIAKARELLAGKGIYGSRVVMHQLKPGVLPYRDRFANLVVSVGEPPISAAEVFRVLRPSGGVLLVTGNSASDKKKLLQWGSGAVPGWKVDTVDRITRGLARRGGLRGSGSWSHQYGDSGNTACSGDELVRGAMTPQWFGRPGPLRMVDRHNRSPAPLYRGGRLFISGMDYIVGMDAYNGTVLWEKDLPGSMRLAIGKNCGNMALADDFLYVAAKDKCLAFDVRTGETKSQIALPSRAGREWGYVAVVGEVLVGSVMRPEPLRRKLSRHSWKRGYFDNMPVVCSDSVHGVNRKTGRVLWSYTPPKGVIVNPAIAAGAKGVYFIESDNPASRQVATGRIRAEVLLSKGAHLTVLDVRSGKTLWRKPVKLPYRHNLFLNLAEGICLVSGTSNGDKGAEYSLFAFNAADGGPIWQAVLVRGGRNSSHGLQDQHPAVVGDTIYLKAGALKLKTGKRITGWSWTGRGCGTISSSSHALFMRGNYSVMRDLETGKQADLVTRPGCWINIIPAGGLVLIPEGSSGCTCPFPIQTSIAFAPRERYVSIRSARTEFKSSQEITLHRLDESGTIRYTIDSKAPTSTSKAYDAPVTISKTCTIAAAVFEKGKLLGGIDRRKFTRLYPAPVVRSDEGRGFLSKGTVELVAPAGAVSVHYTTDGTDPTPASPKYSGALTITRTTTVKALAVYEDGTPSRVACGAMTKLEDLLARVCREKEAPSRTAALHDFVEQSLKSKELSSEKMAGLYAMALKAVDRIEDRKALFGGLGKTRSPASMRVALLYIDNKNVASEAGRAVIQLAEGLAVDHPGEAKSAVTKVMQVATEPAVRDKASLVLTKLDNPNLARSATASSPDGLKKDGGASGDQAAVDGNPDTYWDEQDGAKLYRLRLDFQQPRDVAVISIEGYAHHKYAPKDFDIVCDGKVVKEVRKAAYKGNKLIVKFPASKCKSLELKITGYYGRSPAIRELEVYGAAKPGPAKEKRGQ